MPVRYKFDKAEIYESTHPKIGTRIILSVETEPGKSRTLELKLLGFDKVESVLLFDFFDKDSEEFWSDIMTWILFKRKELEEKRELEVPEEGQ